MNARTKQPRQKYTLECKQDAARLVNEKGYAHQQAAEHLGVSLRAIGRWSRAERVPAAASSGKKTALSLTDQTELIQLRRENEQLPMEREILKKAAVIKAKEIE